MNICGLDLGYSQAKLVVSSNPGGLPRKMVYPAGAGPLSQLPKTMSGDTDLGGAVRVDVDGEAFAALAEPRDFQGHQRPLHEDYAASREYRALFYGSLVRVGARRIDYLITGLPVAQAKNRSTRERLESQLQGEHLIRDGMRVTVDRVRVLPQPVGAWLSWLNDNKRYQNSDIRALMFDVGFYSVDWCLLDRGKIQDAASGSSCLATSAILERAVAMVAEQYGTRISLSRLEEALRTNKPSISAGAKDLEMAPLMKAAAASVSSSVLNQVKQSLRALSDDVNFVLLAGGGSGLFAGAVAEAFPSAKISYVDDPVMANARGFYYYGEISVA